MPRCESDGELDMKKSYNRKYILLSVVVFVYLISSGPLFGQEFPYLAPQAPEFDARGNLIPSAPTESRGPNYSRQSEETISSNNQPPDGNYFKPGKAPFAAPSAPGLDNFQNQQSTGGRTSTASAPAVQRNPVRQDRAPSSGFPTSVEQRPTGGQTVSDCSLFPAMIAQARSQAEMQMTARQFLTCLMQSGWNPDQAKQHVISVIKLSRTSR